MPDDNANDDDQFLTNNPDDTKPQDESALGEELEEDSGGTPFSPPDDVDVKIDDTFPATDSASDIDTTQQYHGGIQEAANIEPPSESAVTDYRPPSDPGEDDDLQVA